MSMPTAVTGPITAELDPISILLPAGRSHRRPGALAASAIFGWRALLKIKHDPKQLVESAAIPILFTVLFTYLFGGAIGGSTGHYLTMLLPGTLTMSIAIVTMYGGARIAQDVTTGAFDRFRSLSVWRGAFVLGGLISDACRYLFAAAIVMVLGLIIGYRPAGGASGVLAATALIVAFALSLWSLWAAVALLVSDRPSSWPSPTSFSYRSRSPATSSSSPGQRTRPLRATRVLQHLWRRAEPMFFQAPDTHLPLCSYSFAELLPRWRRRDKSGLPWTYLRWTERSN